MTTHLLNNTGDLKLYELMKNHPEKGFIMMEAPSPIDVKYITDSNNAFRYLLENLRIADYNISAVNLLGETNISLGNSAFSVLGTQFETDADSLRPFFTKESYSNEILFSDDERFQFRLHAESITIYEDGFFTGLFMLVNASVDQSEFMYKLQKRDQLLSATAKVNHTLLLNNSIEKGIYTALDIIGKATDVDRVYVFENYIDELTSKYFCNQRIEWTKDSITAQIDNEDLQDFPMSDLTPRWIERMLHGKAVNGLVKTFPKSERDILEPQDIISILVVPILINNSFWGFVGFDNCTSEYKWTDAEVEVLTSLASNIGLAYERIRTQQELMESQQKLEEALEAEKEINELKDRFIAMISHEIRTPITAIVSSLDLLESYADRLTEEKKRHIHKRMLGGSNRIIELVEEVLLIGKVNAGKMYAEYTEFDLNILMSAILEDHKEGSLKEHDIRLSVDLEKPVIRSDKRLTAHIINNLLSNAGKYSKPGSTVRISCSEQNGQLIYMVKDHGIGISTKDHKRIFEPFYRSREVFDIAGTGLGLTIVKGSVEAMNGTIEVESEKGKGSTFMVTLPI